jgi:hypothetical protein
MVRLVQHDHIELLADGSAARELLDTAADEIDAAIVAGVEIQDALFPTVPVKFVRERERGAALPDARRSGEEKVRHL